MCVRMADVMHGILAEAKKNRYSSIKDNLSDDGKCLTNFNAKRTGVNLNIETPIYLSDVDNVSDLNRVLTRCIVV